MKNVLGRCASQAVGGIVFGSLAFLFMYDGARSTYAYESVYLLIAVGFGALLGGQHWKGA